MSNAVEIGRRIAEETGATLVHPYNDWRVIAGQDEIDLGELLLVRREILDGMAPLKVRPSPNEMPWRYAPGTPSFEDSLVVRNSCVRNKGFPAARSNSKT